MTNTQHTALHDQRNKRRAITLMEVFCVIGELIPRNEWPTWILSYRNIWGLIGTLCFTSCLFGMSPSENDIQQLF